MALEALAGHVKLGAAAWPEVAVARAAARPLAAGLLALEQANGGLGLALAALLPAALDPPPAQRKGYRERRPVAFDLTLEPVEGGVEGGAPISRSHWTVLGGPGCPMSRGHFQLVRLQ